MASPAPNAHEGRDLAGLSGHIRIYELDPSDSLDEPITGTMMVVPLAATPEYACLSYVWGQSDEERCNKVYIRDQRDECLVSHDIEVTMNCIEALKRIRSRKSHILIWIDAVCVNQDNVQERNERVNIMGEIYSKAATVYIWLGHEDANSDTSFDLFEIAYEYSMKREPFVPTYGQLRSLQDFLNRDWFKRGWTFQELVLASNPIFLCGTKSQAGIAILSQLRNLHVIAKRYTFNVPESASRTLSLLQAWQLITRLGQYEDKDREDITKDWSALEGLQRLLEAFYLSKPRKVAKGAAQTRFKSAKTIIDGTTNARVRTAQAKLLRDLRVVLRLYRVGAALAIYPVLPVRLAAQMVRKQNAASLSAMHNLFRILDQRHYTEFNSVIYALRSRELTNPKDRSYALYGALKVFEIPLTPPDYSKSTGEVFMDLFSDLLRWRPPCITLLLDAGRSEPSPTTPTWIPQYAFRYGLPAFELNGLELTVYARAEDGISHCFQFPSHETDAGLEVTETILHWL